MQDQGGRMFPKSGRELNKKIANAECCDCIENGVWVMEFDYKDVYDNLEEFKKLMASDNWNADLELGDNEVSIGKRMILLIKCTQFKGFSGTDLDKAVIGKLKETSGEKFRDQDLSWILNWAKTTASSVVDFLQPLQKYLVDPAQYSVPPQQLGWMASVVQDKQWLRATQFVRMYSASQDTEKGEVKIINGKLVSNVVTEKTFQVLKQNILDADPALMENLEQSIGQIVDQYWHKRSTQLSANDLLSHLGGILKKVADAKHGSLK